ncbi:MAG: DUF3501 family protein [Acidimicrobiales bacterium]
MDKLTLDDIVDLRAYERERAAFRSRVIARKKLRRIPVGPVVTVLFENRDTIRFQLQEMARAERMLTDEAIQVELDTYNPLVPEPGRLAATLFIELTDETEMLRWLPELVGIERSVKLRIGDGDGAVVVRGAPEEAHAEHLTREEVTASVHYVFFELTPEQVDALDAGPVVLAVDHDRYLEATPLASETVASLVADLRS